METLFLLDFVKKLCQVASALESFFVDAEDPVSVHHATETFLDAAVVVCHVRPPNKLNFEMTTPNIDSAVGPRKN